LARRVVVLARRRTKKVRANVVVVDDGDLRGSCSIPSNSGQAGDAVKAPDRDCSRNPILVSPLQFEALVDVEVATDDNEDHHNDVPCEEDLIRFLA